jgi:nitrogen fixation NifU-like protein
MSARELYQEIILDHAQSPHHSGRLDAPCCQVHRDNVTCGDAIDLFARIEDGRIAAVAYESAGCAISTASASMMSDAISGLTMDEAAALLAAFRAFMTQGTVLPEALEALEALDGVRKFPARVKCALLAWGALEDVLAGKCGS